MGSTITTNKLAAAFKTATGNIMYVLYEETYESNCVPHEPRWSCCFAGDVEGAVRQIFGYASSCEGGMLRGRNGSLTPEGYIAGWMKELSAPRIMPDLSVTLAVKSGMYASIPEESAEAAFQILRGIDRTDLADLLADGKEVALTLHNDAEVLAAVYQGGSAGILAPWRAIASCSAPIYQPRVPDLGYVPTPAKGFVVQRPAALRVGNFGDILLQRDDGSWYCAGTECAVIADFVRDLWKSDLKEPGSFRSRIRAYREALRAGIKLDPGITVVVDRTVPVDEWQEQDISALMNRFPVSLTDRGFSIVTNDENYYLVTCLPAQCATWVVPDQQVPFVPAPVTKPVQMSLI